eukprot:scaffold111218_cov51-Attheya_sp.AAC.1
MIHRAISFHEEKNNLEEQLSDALEKLNLKEKEIEGLKNQLNELKVSLDDYKSILQEEKQTNKVQQEEIDRLCPIASLVALSHHPV